ncbi:unnamed protein product [Ixodes hexagonus]
MSYRCRNTFATLPRTQRGMPLVLGGDPKGKNFLYTNGNSVIIRDIANPSLCDIYTEHSQMTTVAKYSPSGFYIASADQTGKIRIWDTVQKEHILKNEFQPFVGVVKDLAWSPDSQRIMAVGEGRERFGHVFMAETGTSVGEIGGHSKQINSCDFRPTRPFRIITGSEDNTVGIYEGPPFKYKLTISDHTRFVQSVRYSPNGELFASGGFDGKMFLYNASTYEKVGEFGSPAHGGGIYAVSWSPDNTKILTASGDRTCKIWDASTMSVVTEFVMGPDVLDQQVSCLWQGSHLLSVSLSGFINYLDVNNPEKPLRVLKGHHKSITALAVSPNRETVYTGTYSRFCARFWDAASGDQDRVAGTSHTNQVQDMCTGTDSVYTCGLDDTVRSICLLSNHYSNLSIKMDSQPRGMATADGNLVVVADIDDISLIENNLKVATYPIDYEASSVTIHPKEPEIAVGGTKDHKVHVYVLKGHSIEDKTTMDHAGAITDVRFSPDGQYLAASDSNRMVRLYVSSTYELAHNLDWCFHTARVNCIGWSPDSKFLATGSLDTGVIIWSTEQPMKHINIKKAHPQSQITRLAWLDNSTIVSAGQDSNVKIWEVKFS